jgi:hypothetical protein
MICHPMVVEWTRSSRKRFADEGNQLSMFRTGLVWDTLKDINEKIAGAGGEILVPDVPIDFEMALTLHFILSCSVRPEVLPQPAEGLFAWLQSQKDGFVSVLDAHPRGIQRSKESRRKMRSGPNFA